MENEFLTLELRPCLGGHRTDVVLRGQIETVIDPVALALVVRALRRWTCMPVDIALRVADPCMSHQWFAAWLTALNDPAMLGGRQMDLF